jgi:hypothetical protein
VILRNSKKLVVQFVVSRPRRIAGVLVLGALVLGGLAWRASWISNRLLRSWTSATIRERSDSVYRMAVGRVRLSFALRRLTVDSVRVTTNRALNARRPRPLATLDLAFHSCTVSGVHLVTLARGGGLVADSFRCEEARVAVATEPGALISDVKALPAQRPFLAVQQGIRLPSFAPSIHIGDIDFPAVHLDVRSKHRYAPDSRVELEQFRWHMTGFAMNPGDDSSAARPLFSRTIEFAADDFVARPDSTTVIRIARLAASLTDSTMDIHGVAIRPLLGDAAFLRSRPYRRMLVKTRIAHIGVRGIDVGAFLLGYGLRARYLLMDSLRVDLTSDRNLPPNANPRRRRTPQEWVADLDREIQVDSMLVRHGRVVFRLLRPDRDQPGVITFARLEALALGVNTGAPQPMRLTATTYLQNAGRLTAHFVVPLSSPRFDMSFRGMLGPMAADEFNDYVVETFPLRITNGQVASIAFRATVTNGSARGTITPIYDNLALAVTRTGSTGILGRGGFFGGAARKIASLAGNWKMVYARNPEEKGRDPRVAAIRHTFTTNETLPAFIWTSLREGLLTILKR